MAPYRYLSGIHDSSPDLEIVCGSDAYYERLDRRDYYAPPPPPLVAVTPTLEWEPVDQDKLIEEEAVELIGRISTAKDWYEVLSLFNGVTMALYDPRNPAPEEMQIRLRAELEAETQKFKDSLGK